jgi:hypothetical protein
LGGFGVAGFVIEIFFEKFERDLGGLGGEFLTCPFGVCVNLFVGRKRRPWGLGRVECYKIGKLVCRAFLF